ncbi:unnamed protein product [Rhizoctonia solani]|uniref:DUF6535 domain-containing protein n=1 Tax=Rhizoctonia solani TaxID=456999 RepID=A0A8H3C2Z2_9AGAM|nr:unnamed protein product [Rhizoctonia solani]
MAAILDYIGPYPLARGSEIEMPSNPRGLEDAGRSPEVQNPESHQQFQPPADSQIFESLSDNITTEDTGRNIPGIEPAAQTVVNHIEEGNPPKKTKPVAKGEIPSNDPEVEEMKTDLTASKSAPLWDKYLKLCEPGDKAILADLEGSIEVTLVFAALFSAISTGFLLESSKGLNPDPNAATVLAIRELTAVVQAGLQTPTANTSSSGPEAAFSESPFKPSVTIVWVNCLWFLSLGLSISVSLFAMLAKRLCYKARLTYWGTPYDHSMQRQEAWEALEKWKFRFLVEQLSMIMHIALILFFVSLVLYLSEVHLDTMIITAIPIGLTMLSYLVLTMLPLIVATFPMVTPFSRYIQAGFKLVSFTISTIQPLFQSFSAPLYAKILAPGIRNSIRPMWNAVRSLRPGKDDKDDTKSQSSSDSAGSSLPTDTFQEQWVIKGCPKRTAKILNHLAPQKQRNAFRALLWLLKHSNDKKLINEVLEYVNNYPEVVLDSCAGHQPHFEATLAVARHFHRLQRDAIEWHDLNQFRAKCGRFMYLNARPWLHSVDSSRRRLTEKVFNFLALNSPFMRAEEVEGEVQTLNNKKLSVHNCTSWLELQAVKITLGCPPDAGLKMCKELFKFVVSKVEMNGSGHEEEIYSTLSWMFLNTAIGASDERSFWPVPYDDFDSSYGQDDSNNRDAKPVANFDSTLTLSYFRHSETRRKKSLWLKVVGLSGILYAITYIYANELEPDLETNSSYYESIIQLLGVALKTTENPQLQSQPENDDPAPYVGKLPVYWKSQIRLYEFDSRQYCRDALDRAIDYSKFARFHDALKGLKELVPEYKGIDSPFQSKPEFDIDAPPDLLAHPQNGPDMV